MRAAYELCSSLDADAAWRWVDGQLLYAGKAETGFKQEMLYELRERLDPYIRKASEYLARRALKLVRRVHGAIFHHMGPLPPIPTSVHELKIGRSEGGEGTRLSDQERSRQLAEGDRRQRNSHHGTDRAEDDSRCGTPLRQRPGAAIGSYSSEPLHVVSNDESDHQASRWTWRRAHPRT
jgi:hypothetical protein